MFNYPIGLYIEFCIEDTCMSVHMRTGLPGSLVVYAISTVFIGLLNRYFHGCILNFIAKFYIYINSARVVHKGVATYTQKPKCVHIWTKNMGRFYLDGMCIKCVCRTNIFKKNSKSYFKRMCDDV